MYSLFAEKNFLFPKAGVTFVQAASVNNMLTFMFAIVPLIAGITVLFIYYKLNVQEVNAKEREANA